jgi:hypothetical protein
MGTTVGSVGLFELRDDTGNVLDRVAVKDTYMGTKDWEKARRWTAGADDKTPLEYALNEKVFKAFNGSSPSVVQCLTCAVYEDRCMHRIYMEFCEKVWHVRRCPNEDH